MTLGEQVPFIDIMSSEPSPAAHHGPASCPVMVTGMRIVMGIAIPIRRSACGGRVLTGSTVLPHAMFPDRRQVERFVRVTEWQCSVHEDHNGQWLEATDKEG